MATGNTSNFQKADSAFGATDLDDEYITDAWLIDQFVGNTIFSWGNNIYGQVGNNSINLYSSPIQIGSLTSWKRIILGSGFITASKTDGTLWSCGYNAQGQLGNSVTTNYSSPIQVGSLTNWKQISCGYRHTSVVTTDGTLWAWGQNSYGCLGNNDPILSNQSSPVLIGTVNSWKQVAGGYYHTAAIQSNGTLWTWGNNNYGQLCNGTVNLYYSSPIQVGSLTNWKQVSGGYLYTSLIKTDGTLWCCGYNAQGQLGNSLTIYYSSPIQVGSLTNWKQISCGYYHTAAIKTDGSLWTWGGNQYGQLGNSLTIYYSSPIQVGSLTSWKQVSCGKYHIIALQTNGTLWTWGYNNVGQLGNGTVTNYSSPIQVGSSTNWKQVAGGFTTSFTSAIKFADIT